MGFLKQAVITLLLAYIIQKIPEFLEPKLPPVVEGFFRPEFRKVAETFRSFVQNGRLKGGSFAAFHKGEVLVDLWGGYADKESEVPWRNNTITVAYSLSKGMAAILAGIFVEKGWLDYDKPITHYWPEFGQNGKEEITVRTLLSHQAGLSIINDSITIQMIKYDKVEKERVLAKQTPYWPPGKELAYHSITYGLYVDTLLSKADPKKRRIDQIFKEEIAIPYDIDFMIGVPKQEQYRVARNYPVSTLNMLIGILSSASQWWMLRQFLESDSFMMLAIKAIPEMEKNQWFNNPDVRNIPLSSTVGFGNARSIAKLYGIVANNGKYENKRVVSDTVVGQLASKVISKVTKDMGIELSMGHGFWMVNNTKGQLVFGHPGYGGQMSFGDVFNNVGMAYVTNHLSAYSFGDDPNFIDLQTTFYECLDNFVSKSNKPL